MATTTVSDVFTVKGDVFQRALTFVFRNFTPLLQLAIGPLILQLVIVLRAWSQPLSQQEFFLVCVFIAGAQAWHLNATFMYCMERVRETRFAISRIVYTSYHFLPKVLLSFGAVLFFMFGTYVISAPAGSAPGRLLTAFTFVFSFLLLWAPIFVAAEFYAKVPEEEEDEEEEPNEQYYYRRAMAPGPFFTRMSIWHLGLERSYVFSLTHFATTLKLIVLVWCALALPSALSRVFFGVYQSWASVTFETLLLTVLMCIVYGVAASVFLELLPREARNELALRPVEEAERSRGWGSFIAGALLVIASLSSFYLTLAREKEAMIPEGVETVVQDVSVVDDELVYRVRMTDEEYDFRWFSAERFRVASTAVEKEDQFKQREMQHSLERVFHFDAKGEQLPLHFKPYKGTIEVELHFALGEDLQHAKEVGLYYVTINGFDSPLYKVSHEFIKQQRKEAKE